MLLVNSCVAIGKRFVCGKGFLFVGCHKRLKIEGLGMLIFLLV